MVLGYYLVSECTDSLVGASVALLPVYTSYYAKEIKGNGRLVYRSVLQT